MRNYRPLLMGVMLASGLILSACGASPQDSLGTQAAVQPTATLPHFPAASYTAAPPSTNTPLPTTTYTPAPLPTSSPMPLQAALERAWNFSGGNENWEPFIQLFNGVEMVLVPAGCFEMGTPDFSNTQPVHRVCFNVPFWIDRTEVTNAQFAAFNGQAMSNSYFSGDNRPRETITWLEAQGFCAVRGARLPTEAEWEYAARGPDHWEYPWGNKFDGSQLIYGRTPYAGTAAVGSIPGNASWVGAVDMSGNVWEWIADWYAAEYYNSVANGITNPIGPTYGEYRILRGGSWMNSAISFPDAAYRVYRLPDVRIYSGGFRCVRPVEVG